MHNQMKILKNDSTDPVFLKVRVRKMKPKKTLNRPLE
jgi:hypothetical protein